MFGFPIADGAKTFDPKLYTPAPEACEISDLTPVLRSNVPPKPLYLRFFFSENRPDIILLSLVQSIMPVEVLDRSLGPGTASEVEFPASEALPVSVLSLGLEVLESHDELLSEAFDDLKLLLEDFELRLDDLELLLELLEDLELLLDDFILEDFDFFLLCLDLLEGAEESELEDLADESLDDLLLDEPLCLVRAESLTCI